MKILKELLAFGIALVIVWIITMFLFTIVLMFSLSAGVRFACKFLSSIVGIMCFVGFHNYMRSLFGVR